MYPDWLYNLAKTWHYRAPSLLLQNPSSTRTLTTIPTARANQHQPTPRQNGIRITPRPYPHGNCPKMPTSRKFSTSTMKNAAPSPHTGPSYRTTRLKRPATRAPATKPRDVAELAVNSRTAPAENFPAKYTTRWNPRSKQLSNISKRAEEHAGLAIQRLAELPNAIYNTLAAGPAMAEDMVDLSVTDATNQGEEMRLDF